jgi:hypothetical protein
MVRRDAVILVIAGGLLAGAAGCAYDAPPDVSLVAPPGNRFLVGDPIRLAFSEPVRTESLEVIVWPGRKDLYDREGERLPNVAPILETCTVATSPCGAGGVVLTLTDDRTGATIHVPDEALGPTGQPLVLEVTGRIEDDAGRRKKVSRSFDFQIVRQAWDPYADVVQEDTPADSGPPLPDATIAEGPHFFFAQFTTPISLPQQFWVDARIDHEAGRYLMVLTDADPVSKAPRNTTDPTQCTVDLGEEGFLFVATGRVYQEAPGADPVFEGDAFDLAQTIGPILFERRGMVMRGTVTEQDGRARWDGTMAVTEVYYAVGDSETIYPADQANFQLFQLLEAEVPTEMPRVCVPNPCKDLAGTCNLPSGAWPPPAFCPAD